jgi:hypothetical protein
VTLNATTTDNFMSLPATEISATGFTANWTASATASAYRLDVFTLSGNGDTQSQIILSEDFSNGLPASWSTDGYSEDTDDGTIKMASGSRSCTLTTPTINLSGENNVLYARAKQYSNDNGAILTVKLDGEDLAAWTTSSDFETFSVALPSATSSSSIDFYAASGDRVYLDSVNVSSQASAQTPELVSGFPLTLGNDLSYQVTGLEENSDYYYTVTPIGSSAGVSERISVHTYTTGFDEVNGTKITFSSSSTGIVVRNITANSRMLVYNTLGRKVAEILPESSEFNIGIPYRGVYFIRIECNNVVDSYKVIY